MNCSKCNHLIESLDPDLDPNDIHWFPIDTTTEHIISILVRKNGEVMALASEIDQQEILNKALEWELKE